MKKTIVALAIGAAAWAAQAGPLVTTDLAAVQAFEQGLTVQTFDNIGGRTPQPITSYTSGQAVGEDARLYDQIGGIRFSVGGMVGVDRPALYQLGGSIAGDAHSGDTVLGSVDFDGLSLFGNQSLIEAGLTARVSRLGFWVDPGQSPVHVFFMNKLVAFDKSNPDEDEQILLDLVVQPGQFVGLSLDDALIGGIKIQGTGAGGFTIDDLAFGGADTGGGGDNPVPEPGSLALAAVGLLAARVVRRRA